MSHASLAPLAGRHLFLQEKLGNLKQPAVGGSQPPILPPRLPAPAIEAFLKSGFFADSGSRWLAQKVRWTDTRLGPCLRTMTCASLYYII